MTSQPVCVTTQASCLLSAFYLFVCCAGTKLLLWNILCTRLSYSNNLQINRFLFLSHKAVVSNGSALFLVFQDPGWSSPLLGYTVFTAENRKAKERLKPWNCTDSFCLDLGFFISVYIPLAKESHVAKSDNVAGRHR